LVERLRLYPTQEVRLQNLAEVLEVKSSDLLPTLALFPDDEQAWKALALLLRPVYKHVLDGPTVTTLIKQFKRRTSCLLKLFQSVLIVCTPSEIIDMAHAADCHVAAETVTTTLTHHQLSRGPTAAELAHLLDFTGTSSMALAMLTPLRKCIPSLSPDEVLGILNRQFLVAPKMREQARAILERRRA